MGTLTVVRAGAGTGKTTDLCRHIAERAAAGLDPARIVATTFTRKAATELKGRIQVGILNAPALTPEARVARAERLELAAIGTVHSVGHQLLTRYALALGLSPQLKVLEEGGSARALRDVLGQMRPEPWEELAAIAGRFLLGSPQELALDLLQAKRGNRIGDEAFEAQMRESAERLCHLMAPDGAAEGAPDLPVLYALMEQTLRALRAIRDDTKITKEAIGKLRQLLAARSDSWKVFLDALKIKAGKQSGADGALQGLRGAAVNVFRSPGLHRDVRNFLGELAQQVLALDGAYRQFKAERGLLDFTDLESEFLGLLETPPLAASLQTECLLVAVDEFHDTNPLQLAIFQRLRSLAASSRWVGDAKQSIYGFRGTDAELMRAVWDAAPTVDRESLTKNYRSQRGLVRLVGRLFEGVFGRDETVDLQANRKSAPKGVERWIFSTSNVDEDVRALAAGVVELQREGHSLGKIAILARTNDNARRIGDALRRIGLPVLLELPGLLGTREGAVVLVGLRLVADRHDSLAAATVIHLLSDSREPTPAWLEARLRALREAEAEQQAAEARGEVVRRRSAPWAGDGRLAPLEAVRRDTLSPAGAVQQVLDALEVGNHIRTWGNAAQRLANVDTIVLLAEAYEGEARELGFAATLTGLIASLEQLAAEQRDITRPPYGIDAVTVLTYHESKGLEWSVVVLAGLDFEREADLWSPTVTGGQQGTDDPLRGRTLRYWPWLFGRDQYDKVQKGSGLEEMALRSAEGVEATRRADAEHLRLLYVGFTRAKDKVVLPHREGKYRWLQRLPAIDAVLDPGGPPGERSLDGLETTFVVRHLRAESFDALKREPPALETWLAPLRRPSAGQPLAARYRNPSEMPAEPLGSTATVEAMGGYPLFPLVKSDDDEGPLGRSIHAFFAALPSLGALPESAQVQVANRCLKGFSAEAQVPAADLVAMGKRLQDWLAGRYPGSAWHTEVPITAPRADGSQWNGVIDLLVRLPSGELVIVDHKSSPLRRDQCAKNALERYVGQLAAYREALEGQGMTVGDVWIHYPLPSVMVRLAPDSPSTPAP